MKKFILILISLFLSVSIAAETVYKTTNPDGSVEFTDKNLKDSEEIKIRKTTTFSAPRLPRVSPKKPESTNYNVIIIEPTNDTTIIGNVTDFKVKVSVSVSPSLPSDLQFRYQIGDQFIDSRSSTVSFENVVRGTHVLRVSVINFEDEVVSTGASTTFHLKLHFIKTPPPSLPKKPKAP